MDYRDKLCINCKHYFTPRSGAQIVCDACKIKICERCGKEYQTTASRLDSKYCSLECFHKTRWGEEGRLITVFCENCNQVIKHRRQSSIRENQHFFCSRKCYAEFYTGKPKPKLRNRRTEFCDWCGKEFSRPVSDFHGKHFFCCHPCSAKWWAEFGLHGKEHSNWQGGKGNKYGEDWIQIRKRVLERDKYACQQCGTNEGLIDIHHIIPFRLFSDAKKANHLKNLITLCRSCHVKVEWRTRAMLPLFYAAIGK